MNGFEQKLTESEWIALGKTLKQIHALKIPSSLPIKQETFSHKWRDAVRALSNAPQPQDPLSQQFVSLLKEQDSTIQRLLQRADELSQITHPTHFVLCHSDLHAGNILIQNPNTFFIIDWDEPILAPKKRDLMFIGGGVGNVWNDPHEEHSFYEGYGPIDINKHLLSYYRHERIIQDIAEFAVGLLSFPNTYSNRPEMLHHFTSMFNPNGVVDIALKTDTLL